MPQDGEIGTGPDGTLYRFDARLGRGIKVTAAQAMKAQPAAAASMGGAGMPRADAPGAAYLPTQRAAPNASEDAYYRQWRKDNDPGVSNARKMIGQSREFEGLLSKQDTGGLYGVPYVGAALGFLDPEVRRMESISAEQARSKRQPGEGSVSDFDAKMFQTMVPSKGLPTETNRMIIRAQRSASEQALQQRQMAEWYQRTYGNLSGFDEAWGNYAAANPIWDEAAEAEGRTRLNPNRQTWRQYYGAERGEQDRQPSQAMRDIQRSQRPAVPGSAARGHAAFMRGKTYNSKAKFGSAANPYVARSEEVLGRLPAGSYVIGPDGTFGYIR